MKKELIAIENLISESRRLEERIEGLNVSVDLIKRTGIKNYNKDRFETETKLIEVFSKKLDETNKILNDAIVLYSSEAV